MHMGVNYGIVHVGGRRLRLDRELQYHRCGGWREKRAKAVKRSAAHFGTPLSRDDVPSRDLAARASEAGLFQFISDI